MELIMDALNTMHASGVDEEGFLYNPNLWDRNVAVHIAESLGFGELDADQWNLIFGLRKYYFSHSTTPPLRRICHINKLQNNCVATLFYNQGIELWKIAGLPNPGEEAKAYM